MIVASPTVEMHLCVPHPPLFALGQTVAMAVTVLPDLARAGALRAALADGHAEVRTELDGRHLAPGPMPAVAVLRARRALPELRAVLGHLAAAADQDVTGPAQEQVSEAIDELSAQVGRFAGAVLVTLAGTPHLDVVAPAARLTGARS